MLHRRTNTTITPFHFTGKEKDPLRLYLQSGELCRARLTSPPDLLTGYSYFGARYLEHDLMTGWLSVDPMADKYPSISPYAYCAWNPVRLVDVDGYMIDDYYNLKGELIHHTNEGNSIYLVIKDGEKVDKDRTIALPTNSTLTKMELYRSKLGAILSFVQRFEFGRTGQSINSKDYDPYISFYNKTSDMAIYSMKFSEFKKTVMKINEKCGRP